MAVIPSEEICGIVTVIKNDFAETYNSRAALKSPPHITLVPPFHYELEREEELKSQLIEFCDNQRSFPLELNGYQAFIPRVIYINIQQSDKLFELFNHITKHFESRLGLVSKRRKGRQFSPHMTVAFSDLTKEMFYKAWRVYKSKDLHFRFEVSNVSLLRHNGKMWETVIKARVK